MVIWLLLSVIRLVVPIGILRWPLLVTLLAALIDFGDYKLLGIHNETEYQMYSYWDKFLDTYYLSFAAYTVLDWEDTIARSIGLISFWFRFLGIIIFFILGNETVLFYFPNFFQNLFLFYLLFQQFSTKSKLFTNNRSIIFINLALYIPIMILEYILHVWESTPAEVLQQLFAFKLFPPEITANLITAILLISLPIIALIWKLNDPVKVQELEGNFNKNRRVIGANIR